jgi:hypothetical protein
MMGKLFAGGLLLVLCLELSLAGRVSSQGTIKTPGLAVTLPDAVAGSADLEQAVQELKNIRAQKAELDKREKKLVELIAKRIQAERQQLDRKV